MNKKELVNEVSGKVGITKKEVGNIVDATAEVIREALSKGEKVTLIGFGTFQVLKRKSRRGVKKKIKERKKSSNRGRITDTS